MAEYLTRIEENGTVNIAEDVVTAIVTDAVKEIEGVGAMSQNAAESRSGKKAVRGVRVEKTEDDIVINIYLMARYGYAIPEIARKVQQAVSDAVGGMTGFPVREVNVHVSGISFNE